MKKRPPRQSDLDRRPAELAPPGSFEKNERTSKMSVLSCGIKCTIDLLRHFDNRIYRDPDAAPFQEWSAHGFLYFVLLHWYVDAIINEITSLIIYAEPDQDCAIAVKCRSILKSTLNEAKLADFIGLFPTQSFDEKDLERIRLICRIRDILYHYNADFYPSLTVPEAVDEVLKQSEHALLTENWLANINVRKVSDENFISVFRFVDKALELSDFHDLIGRHQNKFSEYKMADVYNETVSAERLQELGWIVGEFPRIFRGPAR